MHAKNAAELRHGEAGLYRLMPGIILGPPYRVPPRQPHCRLDSDDCGECGGLLLRVQGPLLVVR